MNFIEQIQVISEEHQLFNYNKFNIFKVMFKQHDEKYLHSRFISFLLDPNGSHQQGTKFLELYFEVMGISNFSLEGVQVNPNELERAELYNIDILIQNSAKQAIIIENKFFAKDQTRMDDSDNEYLKYQLTRYYYRLSIEPKNDHKYDVVKIIYLTIDGKDPEDFKYYPEEVKPLVSKKDHLSDIAKWLDLCLAQLNEDSDLKRTIQQFKQARFEFLNDVQLALKLKEISALYFEEAKQFWTKDQIDPSDKYYIIKSQFIHVKWHTVHEFYVQLVRAIKEEFKVNVIEASNKAITNLTHHNKKVATSVIFELNNKIAYYLCNDKNGFSIGRHIENKTEDDFQILFDKNYAFFDFTKPEVLQLIKPKESERLAGEIVDALKEFVNKN